MDRKDVGPRSELTARCADIPGIILQGVSFIASSSNRVPSRIRRSLFCCNLGAVEINDESIIILHPQLHGLEYRGVSNLEFTTHVDRGMSPPHRCFSIGANKRIIFCARIESYASSSRKPVGVVKIKFHPGVIDGVVVRNEVSQRCSR